MYKLSKVFLFITIIQTISVFPFSNSQSCFLFSFFSLSATNEELCGSQSFLLTFNHWPLQQLHITCLEKAIVLFYVLHASDSSKKICGTGRIWGPQNPRQGRTQIIFQRGILGQNVIFIFEKYILIEINEVLLRRIIQ